MKFLKEIKDLGQLLFFFYTLNVKAWNYFHPGGDIIETEKDTLTYS